jgi:TRAP-type C4-dicarboxylate transport system permease small subunit
MFATVLIMVIVVADVICRTVFNKPIHGSYDVVTLFMTVLVFSSWSYTQTEHAHVHVTMFVRKMPRVLKFASFGITSVLSTVYLGYCTWAAFDQTLDNIASHAHGGTVPIPYWPFALVECVALGIFTLTIALDAAKTFGAIKSEELSAEVQSYWI